MHPIWMTAWRPASCCLQGVKTTTDILGLRHAFSVLARPPRRAIHTPDTFLPIAPRRRLVKQEASPNNRQFSTPASFQLHQSSRCQQQLPPRAPSQLAFRRNDLRPYEIKVVFGSRAPPATLGNTLLKTLQSRRVNGTLDLDLPSKIASELKKYPSAVKDALQWLRLNYPVDEDAAILRRIEREDAGEGDEALINRAESLGLYKPQSGTYGARLGEDGDIFGESELLKIRRANELRAEQEEQELETFIKEKQQAREEKGREEKGGALEARRENGLEVSTGSRPPNLYERWKLKHYLNATSKITYEQVIQASKLRLLLPSLLFATFIATASYLFALTWTPPSQPHRLLSTLSLSQATLLGLTALNLLIAILWRFPPAWRLLNRYFISTPAFPRVFANLGNTFSHQSFSHLLWNVVVLWLVGLNLHEDVGRGYFLALYLSSGVIGSVVSLSSMVLRGLLVSSSLGASGAVSGVLAAYCTIHPERITIWLLPASWQEYLSCNASTFLYFVVALEVVLMLVPRLRSMTTDYAAHLGGYAVGYLGAAVWRRDHKGKDGGGGAAGGVGPWGGNREREKRWYEKFLGR